MKDRVQISSQIDELLRAIDCSSDEIMIVEEWLDSMPIRVNEVFYFTVSGLTQAEISGKIGVSQPTVSRAVARIKRWIVKMY